MAKKVQNYERTIRPAETPEARENQLIALAYDQAEKQLMQGVAPAPVVTHFLKLGTMQARLELEKVRKENLLLEAKTEALKSGKHVEELYENALNAMRIYKGE